MKSDFDEKYDIIEEIKKLKISVQKLRIQDIESGKHLIKLNTEGLSRLGSNGIFAPKGAKSCSALTTVTDKSIVDTYSFKNSKKQLTKRIKEVIDRKTGQKTTQVRFYDYIDGMWKSKISYLWRLMEITYLSTRGSQSTGLDKNYMSLLIKE